jgi:hypothetical protein
MRRTPWTLLLAIVLGVAGCSARAPREVPRELPLLTATTSASATSSEWSPPPEPESDSVPDPGDTARDGGTADAKVNVQEHVRRIDKTAVSATVVVDRVDHVTLLSQNGDRQFAAGSLVKLLIGVDALLRHPDDSTVRRKVTTMIRLSDDPLANEFWTNEGGPAIVNRMRARMDLRSTEPPKPATRWGSTLITANDIARIYDYIMVKAGKAEREIIVDAMAVAASTGSDGFAQHFGIPEGVGKLPWAVKQAWTTDLDGLKSTHSTGFVGKNWRYEVILLTEHQAGRSWDTATRSVTVAAQAVGPLLQ